jgi:hypothetical protein
MTAAIAIIMPVFKNSCPFAFKRDSSEREAARIETGTGLFVLLNFVHTSPYKAQW